MNNQLHKAVKRPRSRDATATRADLLKAARMLFSRHGYDMVGIRQIAAEAGVDQALIIRYFGSKLGLFAAAIEGLFPPEIWFEGDRQSAGRRVAAFIWSRPWPFADGVDPLNLLIRSCGHPEANEVLRQAFDAQATQPLADWLEGPHATERAGLLTALVVGSDLLHHVVGSKALTGPDLDATITLLGNAFQRLLDDKAAELPTGSRNREELPGLRTSIRDKDITDVANVADDNEPEIEITPEMIDAGLNAALTYDRDDPKEWGIAAIYEAMEKARLQGANH